MAKKYLVKKEDQSKINNLIILGPSGSGKGTQAELLARKFNLKMLDGGEYLRKILSSKSKESKRVAEKMNKGNLAPTDIIRDWMKMQIFSRPISRVLIFSGQPRMLGEAKLALKWFQESGRGIPLVIFLKVSNREVLKRLEKRYICAKCKKVYTLDAPPKKFCKICGGKIIKRADDTPKLIKNRLAYFKIQVAQTLKFFKKKGILIEVNGEQSVVETHKEIVRKIGDYFKK
ncbi:nucleoside monophosphate kinase [Patescibacteria group bacterium]|nr:nucleoside monophosphate kinase [Patescibacteria group bacterium]MBU4579993.1 nucleoside monophosphate kinase [Patescibacteria group bacterium]